MKQVVQNYKTGHLKLLEVPVPVCAPNAVLIRNRASVVSIGTERMIIDLGKKGLLGKAMARPDQVKRLLEKMKNEGILNAFNQAMNRLDMPVPLGYSSAGIVLETGREVKRFKPGQAVACIGQGFASHADVVSVPEIMCCAMPDALDFEEGAFGMLGVIALHGVRSANLTFGENVGVIGLGLLGLLTAQMLKAYGCNVIATDIDPSKVELAHSLGIKQAYTSEFREYAENFGEGYGLDAVILTVATSSADPINLAVDVSRFGGRVVLVGVADIHPNRNEMWAKEVEIIVSKGAGPGSLEPDYEIGGIDYPHSYVRWTEGRNLGEFIRLAAEGLVSTKPMITHRYPFDDAEKAYSDIMAGNGGPHVGVILQYSDWTPERAPVRMKEQAPTGTLDKIRLGIIGSGLFGNSVLIPAFQKVKGVELCSIAVTSPVKAQNAAKRFGIPLCTADYRDILSNPDIDAVAILTRHSSHAMLVCAALEAGKHVFVEKPLCVNGAELADIMAAHEKAERLLLVGYNRRFAPLAKELKKHFFGRLEPLTIVYRVNAGYVPPSHWVHAAEEGGSRVIGEMCHFVDFMQYLTGGMVEKVYGEMVAAGGTVVMKDNVVVTIKMSDGSVGVIAYSASGDRACPRESVEVMGDGKMAILDDFRQLSLFAAGKKKTKKMLNQDMGYGNELASFVNTLTKKDALGMTVAEIFNSTQAVFDIDAALSTGLPK